MYVFVELDGVIIPHDRRKENGMVCEHCVDNLLSILGKRDKLVINSSWGHYYGKEEFKQLFPKRFVDKITGFTTDVASYTSNKYAMIQEYMSKQITQEPFISIDTSDYCQNHGSNIFHITPTTGFTALDAEMVLDYLGEPDACFWSKCA